MEEAERHHSQVVHVLDGAGSALRRVPSNSMTAVFYVATASQCSHGGVYQKRSKRNVACGGARFAAQSRPESKASAGAGPEIQAAEHAEAELGLFAG